MQDHISPRDGEWARLPKGKERLRGLARTFLWQLCAANVVRSINVPSPAGKAQGEAAARSRGVLLVHLPSLDAYLRSLLPPEAEARTPADQPASPRQ